ncbi:MULTISPECIES: YhgE/Pip domain-containing protein [Bacillus]|uniref:YhgE/Pip domain-containing protein n=1 Tax=Bacillus TaxID=1386 RepID=UPI001E29B4AE|nr:MULTISPECIES: ABC transporter permease [Bacillus]MCC8354508.1 ABC transporter permease [Bacillus sp. AF23]MCM3355580.1 ABC transporter permease [Bacillus halotolerans]
MKNLYLSLLKTRSVIIGLITAIIFQVLFSIIWITGYDHVTDRIDQFKIIIVNEDSKIGAQVANNLEENLKFKITQSSVLKSAMDKLDDRKVQMVIYIPKDFSSTLQNNKKKAKIIYSLNESNPSMLKSVMQTVEQKVTSTINKESVKSGLQFTFEQMNVPSNQAIELSQGLSERVHPVVNNINKVSNFSRLMVPMMLVMASFTGSMLFIMEMNKAAKAFKTLYNRWQRFGARVLLIITATILISTIGSIMVYVMGVHSPQGFITMWFFQMIYVLTFLFLAQVPFFIVGDAGGWVNIAMLSIQLLSSGSTIPRELLSNFYQTVSNFLPATYAVDGIMKLVTGGPSISHEIIMLFRILMGIIVITFILVALQRENKKEKSSNLTNV